MTYKYTLTTTTGSNPADTNIWVNIIGVTGVTGERKLRIPSGSAGKTTTVSFDTSRYDAPDGDIGNTTGIRLEMPHDSGGGWNFTSITVQRQKGNEVVDKKVFDREHLIDWHGPQCVILGD